VSGGPYFEQLSVGERVETAPALTLTSGMAATHQAILGDRLPLALDAELAVAVLGADGPLAHPGLVWDVAIGQSTLLTRRVVANLFYRGLSFRRAPVIGDTLRTTTEVLALRQNRGRPGRPATGLAVLGVHTRDQEGRTVLDFVRCAMLPLEDPEGVTGRADDLEALGAGIPGPALSSSMRAWRLGPYRDAVTGGRPWDRAIQAGTRWSGAGGDVVSSAPELARLTLNVANVHHDETLGRRLVYGGHTIGLAAAQLARVLPELITVVGWHACDHTGPVSEGDTLTSTVELERREDLPQGGALAHLRSVVHAQTGFGDEPRAVLDWRLVALMP
jgi:acyl dehydratase